MENLKFDITAALDESIVPAQDYTKVSDNGEHSLPVQDILGRTPHWVVRWGIVSILAVVMLLLIGSAFVKYPDIISCRITVTTENMPVHLAARTSGKIDTLLVEDRECVLNGSVLAVLENTARYTDIQQMSEYVNFYAPYLEFHADTLVFAPFPKNLSLGELQSGFYRFVKALSDYRYFKEHDYYGKKAETLSSRQAVQGRISQNIRERLKLTEGQLAIQEHLFKVDSALFLGNAISGVEYEQSYSSLLQMRQSYANAIEAIHTASLTTMQTEQEIWELYQEQQDKENELYLSLSGAYGDLSAQLEEWEQKYVFRSPIDGIVALTNYWQKNQHISTGEMLLSIIPTDTCRITGKIMLPAHGIGKVRNNQRINIKFDGFPYMEFGMVEARVGKIAMLPVKQENEMYTVVEVIMPDSLVTSYGQTLMFSQQMQGDAEIITADLSILDRILNPIKSALKR
ncbi:MAG: HlyD family secretion protein [Bacteroides sp.]|nr:HlyD family secretion protein [Bacteroides sp.]MCM1084762.1 HlyD family secretion protein [Bacteroides sp.]